MYIGLYVKYRLLLSDFNETWNLSTNFRKKRASHFKFHENPSIRSRVVPCEQSERRADLTKLTVTFRNFANAPSNLMLGNPLFLLMRPYLCFSVSWIFVILFAFIFQWPRSLIIMSQVLFTYKQYRPIWRLCDRASPAQWYQQPTRSSKICFSFILSSLLYMFRTTVLSIFRSTLTVYTAFWNNVPPVLSAAARCHSSIQTVSPVGSRQHSRYSVTKNFLYSQSAPEDGRNCRPKHVQQAWKN